MPDNKLSSIKDLINNNQIDTELLNNTLFTNAVNNQPFYAPYDKKLDSNPANYHNLHYEDSWTNDLLKAFNQVSISTTKWSNYEIDRAITNYDYAIQKLKTLPIQTDAIINKINELKQKRAEYIEENQKKYSDNLESIKEDENDIKDYATSQAHDFMAAYIQHLHPDDKSIFDSDTWKYDSPNAIGSSLSFVGSQLLASGGVQLLKNLGKYAATKGGTKIVPGLGWALTTFDLLASTATIYKQRQWETDAEATDAFEEIHSQQKENLAKQLGVQDIDNDILNNPNVPDDQKENVRQQLRELKLNAYDNIDELRSKNMKHMIGDLAEAYLTRSLLFNNASNIFKGSRMMNALKVTGNALVTTDFEANEEISQALYKNIAKEKSLLSKEYWKYKDLEKGDSSIDDIFEYLNDRLYAEKILHKFGNEDVYNDSEYRNAASSSYYVTGLMSWLPGLARIGTNAVKYNSLKNTLSKAADTKGNVEGMLFAQSMYENLINNNRGDHYKEIIRTWGKEELHGLDSKSAEKEIIRFEKAEKAYEVLNPDIISKHAFSNPLTWGNTFKQEKKEAVKKALVIGEIDDKILELKLARNDHFNLYGFLETQDESIMKLMEKDPKIKSIDTQIKMYEEQKNILQSEIDDIASGTETKTRIALQKEYNKASKDEKLKLEYIYGKKINPLLKEGEASYMKRFINFYEKFQKESQEDKYDYLRSLIGNNSDIKNIINYVISSGVSIDQEDYDYIKNFIDEDTSKKYDEFLEKEGFTRNEINIYKQYRKLINEDKFEEGFQLIKESGVDGDVIQDMDMFSPSFVDPNEYHRNTLETNKEILLIPFKEKYASKEEKEVQHLNDNYTAFTNKVIDNAVNNVEYSDLNEVNEHIKKIESLKSIFKNVHPDNKQGEQFLNDIADKLNEIKELVKQRLADKQAIQTLSEKIYVNNLINSLNLSDDLIFIEESILYSWLENSLDINALKDYIEELKKNIKKDENGKYLPNALHVESIFQYIKDHLKKEDLKTFIDNFEEFKKHHQKHVLATLDTLTTEETTSNEEISKNRNINYESNKNDYLSNPTRLIIPLLFHKLKTFIGNNDILNDLVTSQDIVKALYKKSQWKLTDEQVQILENILQTHLKVVSINDILNHLNGEYNPAKEVAGEVEEIEKLNDTVYPVEQQFITIRQIVKFLLNKKGYDLISNVGYFQGVAGSGKTSVVLNLLLKLSGIPKDKVFFLGTTKTTTQVLRKNVNDSSTVSEDPYGDFLKADIKELSKNELIVLDEALIKDVLDLDKNFLNKIEQINTERLNNKQNAIKVIISGDPLQIRTNLNYPMALNNNSAPHGAIFKNITVFNALTVSYRTDDNDLLLLQNTFRGKTEKIKELSLSHTDNYEKGTYGVDEIDDIYDIITKRNKSEKSLIIVDTDAKLKKVTEDLKLRKLEDKAEVILVKDSQGRTEEAVYIWLERENLIPKEISGFEAIFNSAMYVATGRGVNFATIVSKEIILSNSIKDDVSKEDFTAERVKNKVDKLKELKEISEFLNKDKKVVKKEKDETKVENNDDVKTDETVIDDDVKTDESDIEERQEEQNEEENHIIASNGFEHNLDYPESGVGLEYLNVGDQIFYVKHQHTDSEEYSYYIVKKIDNENRYALVGIVGKEEFNKLPEEFKNELKNSDFIYGMYSAIKNAEVLTNNQMNQIEKSKVFSGIITKLKKRFFNYSKNHRPLSGFMKKEIDSIISEYIKGSKAEVKRIRYDIKIAQATDALGTHGFPFKGQSYLKISIEFKGADNRSNTKNLWIELIPRKLNIQKDKDIYEPLSQFRNAVEKLQKLTGITYGSLELSKYTIFSKVHNKELPLSYADVFNKLLTYNKTSEEVKNSLDTDEKRKELDALIKEINSLLYKDTSSLDYKDEPSINVDSFDIEWTKEYIITGKKGSRKVFNEEDDEAISEFGGDEKQLVKHPEDKTFIKLLKNVMNKDTRVITSVPIFRKIFNIQGLHVKIDYDENLKQVIVNIFDADSVSKEGRIYKNKWNTANGIQSNQLKTFVYDNIEDITQVNEIQEEILDKIHNKELFKSEEKGPAQIAFDTIAKSNYRVFVNDKEVVIRSKRRMKLKRGEATSEFDVVFAKPLTSGKVTTYSKNQRKIENGKKTTQTDVKKFKVPPITLETLDALLSVGTDGNSNVNNNFGLRKSLNWEDVNGNNFKNAYDHNAKDKEALERNEEILSNFDISLDSIDTNKTTVSNITKVEKKPVEIKPIKETKTDDEEIDISDEELKKFLDQKSEEKEEEDDALELTKSRNTELGNKISKEEVFEILKKIFPTWSQEELEFATETHHLFKNNDRLGLFKKGVLYLLKNSDGTIFENVVKHEAFHKVFRQYLNQNERAKLFKYIKKEYPNIEDELDLEEKLAERFQLFIIFPNKFSGLVYKIFNRIKNLLGFITDNEYRLNDIFADISLGKYTKYKEGFNDLEFINSEAEYSKILTHFDNNFYSKYDLYTHCLRVIQHRLHNWNEGLDFDGDYAYAQVNEKNGKKIIKNIPLKTKEQIEVLHIQLGYRLYKLTESLNKNEHYQKLTSDLNNGLITNKQFLKGLIRRNENGEIIENLEKQHFDLISLEKLVLNQKSTGKGIDIIMDAIYRINTDKHNKSDDKKESDLEVLSMYDEIAENDRKDTYGNLTESVANFLATIKASDEDKEKEFVSPTFAFNAAIELLQGINPTMKGFVEYLNKIKIINPLKNQVRKKLISLYEQSNDRYYNRRNENGEVEKIKLPNNYDIRYSKNVLTFFFPSELLQGNEKPYIIDEKNTSDFYNKILQILKRDNKFKNESDENIIEFIKAYHKLAISNDKLNTIYTRLSSLYKKNPRLIKVKLNKQDDDFYFNQENEETGHLVRDVSAGGRNYETSLKGNLNQKIMDFYDNLSDDVFRNKLFKLLDKKRLDYSILVEFISFFNIPNETLKVLDFKNSRHQLTDLGKDFINHSYNLLENLKEAYEDKTNANDILKNNKVKDSVKFIANILDSTTDFSFSTTYINGEGNKVQMLINANYAIRLIQQIINNNLSQAKDWLFGSIVSSKFFYYNIFNPSGEIKINNILGFVNPDSIEYKDNVKTKLIMHGDETLKDRFLRSFIVGFLNPVSKSIGTDKKGTYVQYGYTTSDRPNVVGYLINLLNNKNIDIAIGNIYEQEKLRSKRLKEAADNTAHDVNFGLKRGILKKQYNSENRFIPDLSADNISKEEYIKKAKEYINNRSINKEILDLIDSQYLNQINSVYDFLLELGLISKDLQNKINKGENTKLHGVFSVYFMQNYINGHHLNQLFQGDIAFYKSADDQIKRAAMSYSPGQIARINEKYGLKHNFGIIVAKDIEVVINEVNDVLNKLTGIQGLPFKRDDAIMFYTPRRAAEIRRGYGADSSFRNTIKDVVHTFDEFGIPVGLKNSGIELTDTLCKRFPILNNIRKDLIALEDKYNTNFELHFPSGVKYGCPDNLVDLNESTILQHISDLESSNKTLPVLKLSNEDYQIQSNPFHEEGKVNLFSQFEYFLDTNTLNPQLSNLVYKINSKLMDIGAEKLFKALDLKVDKDNNILNINEDKLRTVLLNALENGNGNESYVILLKAKDENGKHLISLNYPGIQEKLITTLASRFTNNIIKIKASGNKLILSPNLGIELFEENGELKYYSDLSDNSKKQADDFYKLPYKHKEYLIERKNSYDLDPTGNHWEIAKELLFEEFNKEDSTITKELVNDWDNYEGIIPQRLKYYTGDGPNGKFAEVIAPNSWKQKYNIKIGDFLYNSMLGVRIPTTGIHSAIPFKIVGFSDQNSNTIVAPREIVPLHGSDYDVDSLLVMRNEITSNTITLVDGTVLYNEGDIIGFNKNIDGSNIKNFDEAIAQQQLSEDGFSTFNEHLNLIESNIKQYEKLLLTETNESEIKNIKTEIKNLKKLIPLLYNNIKLHSFFRIITDKKNEKDMGTPISLEKLTGSSAEDNLFSGNMVDFEKDFNVGKDKFITVLEELFNVMGEAFTLDNIKKHIQIDGRKLLVSNKLTNLLLKHNGISPQTILKIAKETTNLKRNKNLNDWYDQAEYHYLNFAGKKLVGIFASLAKGYAYLFKGRENEKLPTSPIKIKLNGVIHDTMSVYEKSTDNLMNTALAKIMNNVWEIWDTLINLAVDNVKEQKLDIVNATSNTGKFIGYFNAMNLRFVDNALIMSNKVFKDFVSNIMNKNMYPKSALFLIKSEIEKKLSEKNISFSEIQNEGLTTQNLFRALSNNHDYDKADLTDLKTYYLIAFYITEINNKIFPKLSDYQSAISTIQENNIDVEGIEKTQADIDSLKETGLPFENTNPLELEHIKTAVKYHTILHNTLKYFFKTLNKKIDHFLFTELKDAGLQLKKITEFDSDIERKELRKEFFRYLMSTVFDDKDLERLNDEIRVLSKDKKETIITGINAWIHRFAEDVGKLKAKLANDNKQNKFLDFLTVTTKENGQKDIEWHLGSNKGGPQDIKLMEEFMKLSLDNGKYGDVQKNLVKYGAIIYGDKFAIKSFSLYLPPDLLANNANQFIENIDYLINNDKFDNIKLHFLLSYVASEKGLIQTLNNSKREWYTDDELVNENIIPEDEIGTIKVLKKTKLNAYKVKDFMTDEESEKYEKLETVEKKKEYFEALKEQKSDKLNIKELQKIPLIVRYNNKLYIKIDEDSEKVMYKEISINDKSPAYYLTKDIIRQGVNIDILTGKKKSISVPKMNYGQNIIKYSYVTTERYSKKFKNNEEISVKLYTDPLGFRALTYTVNNLTITKEGKNAKGKDNYKISYELVRNNPVSITKEDINNLPDIKC